MKTTPSPHFARRIRAAILALWVALPALAAPPDSVRTTLRTQLFGVGRTNVLDTYLSPHEYAGPSVQLLHLSERQARWGGGRVTVEGVFQADAAYMHRTVGGGHDAWYGTLGAAVGWHYNWQPAPSWRLAVGGLAELSAGFTYITRGGNNPAQGRAGFDCALSAVAAHDFRLWRRTVTARAQLDLPLVGAVFSPDYGQSYYEIFSLGHYSRNVRFVYPGNAPSARLMATLHVPMGRSVVAFGYVGDVRQSHVNHLKYHAWSHRFVIGYVRRIRLCR